MSVYTNDLYNNNSSRGIPEGGPGARPASPLYQPASARPSTPTPRSAERLQQQRIATPSRLAQAERAASPSQRQRLQQQQQQVVVALGLSTANVPAATAEGRGQQSADGNAVPAAALAANAAAQQGGMGKQTSPLQAQRQAQGHDLRPGTAPASAATSSPRISSISLTSLRLKQEQQPEQQPEQRPGSPAAATPRPASVAGGSIAVDSPRVRQQVLRNFAGAVPAGSGSGASSGSPRLALHWERDRASDGSNRPSTPSFQPVAAQSPRPATALPTSVVPGAAASPAAAGPHFGIKAAHGRAFSGMSGAAADGEITRPAGAYPQPPVTAPPKAPAQAQAPGSQQQPQPGSLASFGIASAAFVAAAPKTAAAAVAAGEGEADGGKGAQPMAALTQAAILANASFANKADLRWVVRWTGGMTLVLLPAPSVDSCAF